MFQVTSSFVASTSTTFVARRVDENRPPFGHRVVTLGRHHVHLVLGWQTSHPARALIAAGFRWRLGGLRLRGFAAASAATTAASAERTSEPSCRSTADDALMRSVAYRARQCDTVISTSAATATVHASLAGLSSRSLLLADGRQPESPREESCG